MTFITAYLVSLSRLFFGPQRRLNIAQLLLGYAEQDEWDAQQRADHLQDHVGWAARLEFDFLSAKLRTGSRPQHHENADGNDDEEQRRNAKIQRRAVEDVAQDQRYRRPTDGNQRQRNHDLPAKRHQAVVADARQRGAYPDHAAQEQ